MNFWKDQWYKTNKKNLIFSWILAIIIFWSLVLLLVYYQKRSWIDAITTASAIIMAFSFLIYVDRFFLFSFWLLPLKNLLAFFRRKNQTDKNKKNLSIAEYKINQMEKSIIPTWSIGLISTLVLVITLITDTIIRS
ncbi:hypothetical protein MCAV_07170 [[Mycoplasma] cavipharyngis]|uniref:hypothetical protein n=1 Tax=[Mycoplasma] cavipharyngis TaxID=92757 RepID=UPI003704A1E7